MRVISFAVAAIVLAAASVSGARYNLIRSGPGPRDLRLVREDEASGAALPGFAAPDVLLVGEYNDTMLQTGWDVMKLVTNLSYPDEQQAYAAGYFEGLHTSQKAISHTKTTTTRRRRRNTPSNSC
jgi:hypothetical protein